MVEVMGRNAQNALWRLRREALMRAWSLKTAAQPVSFLEDGAVPLHKLADYAASLEALFGEYGVRSAFYGNVGQGALNVRPILNLQNMQDRRRMRALADEMAELIRAHGGVLTSGHGLGIARGEGLADLRGPGVVDLFTQLKLALDPGGWLNPGKIIRPPRFDDELILRAPAAIRAVETPQPIGAGHSSSPARALDHARRCSGLSLCRSSASKFDCPSYNATREERDSPRGRANTMRLALSGQLGDGALASKAMLDTMSLCVSCKLCKTACPSAIDIPKMKADTLAGARAEGHKDRAAEIVARLPTYTARARRWRTLLNLRDVLPGVAPLTERYLGLAADRPWPKWVGRQFKAPRTAEPGPQGLVALFADTFNQAFEPANLRAAASVLRAAGYGVIAFAGEEGAEPLCCGRTYYNAGYMEEAKREAERFSRALVSFQNRGVPVIGLEPSCALMLRDEYAVLGFPAKDKTPILLFEEFVAQERAAGRFSVPLKEIEADLVLQSHCHERSFGLEEAAHTTLALVPSLSVSSAPPSCCGLNGAVGMTPQTFEASLAMAELALFPAIRKAGRDAFVAATGYSCRKQIHDGLGLTARHPALILELALKGDAEIVA
jgi:Fe-S oxidoreductase